MHRMFGLTVFAPLSIGICTVLCACAANLKDVDARTDRLLRARVDRLGGGAVSPERAFENPVGPSHDRAVKEKEPGSTNPSAEDLTFKAAAENRDVAGRLSHLQIEDLAGAKKLALPDSLRQAQETAREHLTAQEDYILAAIRLLIERHRFSPRLFADVGANYAEAHTDGARAMTLRLLGEAGVRQQLPFGGQVEAKWVWQAAEDLRNAATGRYVQSSSIVIDGSLPLLRGFGDVAQEDLIQAERSLVYAARDFENFRRTFLVAIARDYFNLLQQQDGIESQVRQLDSLESLERRQRAWYDAGRIREFEVNLASNNVLAARANLANQREGFILSLDRFKVRLGVPVREPVTVANSSFTLPEPETTLEAATEAALAFRLDLQNQRDRVNDSRRQIDIAYNNLLPDLNLTGSMSLPTKAGAREGGSVYEFDDAQYNAGVTFALPLDREIERLRLRQQTIAFAQARRGFDKFRDELILDVRGRTRELERARLNLRLAEERVKINLRRQEEQELKPDEVTTQERVDTANDIRGAESARDQARADLRNAVLNFLLATGELRVRRDGTFEPLPGMGPIGGERAPADPAAQPAAP